MPSSYLSPIGPLIGKHCNQKLPYKAKYYKVAARITGLIKKGTKNKNIRNKTANNANNEDKTKSKMKNKR